MIIGIDISRANQLHRTGVEWYAFYLLQELKKIVPNEHTVRLYTRDNLVEDLADLPKNWEVKVLRWPPKKLWTQLRLSIEMLLHKPDVLFIPAHVAPVIRPKKTVMTLHDVAAIDEPQAFSPFERWYSTFAGKQSAKVWQAIVPSQKVYRDFTSHFDKAKEDHIHIIQHGYSPEFGKPIDNEVSQAIHRDLGIEKKFILFTGRIEYKKNTDTLVKAFNIISKDRDVQLVLLGKSGHGFEDIRALCRKSEFADDIIMPGWVSQEAVVACTRSASVYFFATRQEGFGIPALEALAAGAPLVASSGGSVEEIVGDAALLVDPEDVNAVAHAMSRLLDDDELKNRCVQKGEEVVKLFSWGYAANLTLKILMKKDV